MRRTIRIIGVLMTVTMVAVMAACQTERTMFTPCQAAADGDVTGTDGTYVLVCEDGEWEPVMTVREYLAMRQGRKVTIAPLPRRPTPTFIATQEPWPEGVHISWEWEIPEGGHVTIHYRHDDSTTWHSSVPLRTKAVVLDRLEEQNTYRVHIKIHDADDRLVARSEVYPVRYTAPDPPAPIDTDGGE